MKVKLKRRARRRFRALPNPGRVDRPRHFHWHRNPEAEVMRRALTGYHARGQRVVLGHPDMDVSCRIEKQLTGGPGALFDLVLDDPLGQEDYEAALGLFGGQAGKVFEQAAREGRLDAESRLKRIRTPWSYIHLDVPRSPRGTLVEYQTEDPHHVSSFRDTPGRIVGSEVGVGRDGGSIIYMELFEPLSLWQLPLRGLALEHSKPGFWSKTAYFMSVALYQDVVGYYPTLALKIGPVQKVEGTERMGGAVALKEPMPLDDLKSLLRPKFGKRVDEGEGELAMVLYFVLPLWYGGAEQKGIFRPMREDLAKGLELEVFEGAEWLEGLS